MVIALAIPAYSQGRGTIHSMQHFKEDYGELPQEVRSARKKGSAKKDKKTAAEDAARIAEMKKGRKAFRGDTDFASKHGTLPGEVEDARLDARLKAAGTGKKKMSGQQIDKYRKQRLAEEKQKKVVRDQFPPQRRKKTAGKKTVKFGARMRDDDSLAEEYYYDDDNAYADDRDAYMDGFDDEDLFGRLQQESYLRGYMKGYENAKRFK
eukprot:CAMPEP_0202727204 /NCGR_PEP_ID=MMETSP1385-20130828/185006_1 /ASSEMBLY_ACC=CAM_ASM_000861 /TAXON_ID=933848 /ORGANISM="Elphidium margaritaceum" /LENGTH=207 /DNA_ID=CAMNT_0049393443 /DNA_START=81 /DNA_END=704 /DNA_ORIENTATION=+